jgi:hypothetical protein
MRHSSLDFFRQIVREQPREKWNIVLIHQKTPVFVRDVGMRVNQLALFFSDQLSNQTLTITPNVPPENAKRITIKLFCFSLGHVNFCANLRSSVSANILLRLSISLLSSRQCGQKVVPTLPHPMHVERLRRFHLVTRTGIHALLRPAKRRSTSARIKLVTHRENGRLASFAALLASYKSFGVNLMENEAVCSRFWVVVAMAGGYRSGPVECNLYIDAEFS